MAVIRLLEVGDRDPKLSRATNAGGTLRALVFERLPGDGVPEGK
jgi:hypothetical protein